jgi:phosphonate degradation associated HDIG domain protein
MQAGMSIRKRILDIYTHRATARYGLSDVNQLQHALQSASLAEAGGEPVNLVAAALLHDIGHMIHDLGEDPGRHGIDDRHEELAAEWLSAYFGPAVTEPIRLHVPAKRYLCAVDPDYLGKLAEDSARSLVLQGGPMSPNEVAAFRRMPYYEAAVRLRRYDDLAKDPRAVTPSFEHFLPAIDAACSTPPTA